MGVQGLWQVLEPVGKPVALETLENKVLGVDVSLWLHQAVKGMRDGQGQPVSNAHLVVLLQRVCKLLFYRIKPVFVFDGGVPQLKRQTLAARHQRQAAALEEAQRQRARRVLIAHAQRRLQRIQGPPASPKKGFWRSPKKSPRKGSAPPEDIFELPPLPAPMDTLESDDEEIEDSSTTNIDVPDTVDVEAEDFSMLPADIRHNILVELHQRQRYGHYRSDLPKDSESFSGYQMSRLLKKRVIQEKLEEARRDLTHLRTQQWIAREEQEADIWRVASEDNAHQILLRKGPSSNVGNNPSSSRAAATDVCVSAGTKHNDTAPPQRSWTLLRKGRSHTEPQSGASAHTGTSGVTDVSSARKISLSVEPVDIIDSTGNAPLFHELTAPCSERIHVPEISSMSSVCCTEAEVCHVQTSKRCNVEVDKISEACIDLSALTDHRKGEELTSTDAEHKKFSKALYDHSNDLKHRESYSTCNDKEALSACVQSGSSVHRANADAKVPPANSDRKTTFCHAEQCDKMREERDCDDCEVTSTTKPETVSAEDVTGDKLTTANQCSFDKIEDLSVDNEKCATEFISNLDSMPQTTPDRNKTTPQKRSAEADGIVVELNCCAPDDLFADVFPTEETEEERQYRAELDQCLEESGRHLEAEAGRLELQAAQLSQQMSKECQELLRLLGMPYLVSPEEAEAQCAQLEQLGLTQGTVTDDSDVWLFGGTSVYKHFFQREKFVEHFAYNDILRHFGLDRHKMIAFALLSGSDYTTGIHGVGPVNAMEIISEFQASDAMATLGAFREWLEKAKLEQVSPGSTTRSHLLRFELTPGFPSSVVVDAYLKPATDSSRESFTWGIPDLDALRTFGLQKLGWTREKIDSLLLPVLKRLQEKQSQSRIDSYFNVETSKRDQLFPSKRLRRATKKVAQQSAKQKGIAVQEPALSEESD